jgi:hypothetical protein
VILLTHWTWEEVLDNMTSSRFKALVRRNEAHARAMRGEPDPVDHGPKMTKDDFAKLGYAAMGGRRLNNG